MKLEPLADPSLLPVAIEADVSVVPSHAIVRSLEVSMLDRSV